MKNVPQLRFADFDGEWEEFKLSDLGRISAGGDVDKKKIKTEGKYPVIANGDFNNGIIGYYDEDYKISEPAVTISARGNIGTAVARNYPFTPVIRVLTFISDNNIYFMSEVFNRLRIYNESSGVPQLTSPQFGEYKIFSTQLHEQEKIGDLFRKIDALIEKQEGKVSKMEDFKKSMLQKTFPKKGELVPEFRFDGFYDKWQRKRLHEIGKTYTSLSGKSADDFGHGEASYVTYMNVYKNPIAKLNGVGLIEIDNNQNEVLNGDFFFTTSSETPEEVGLSSAWIYDKSNIYLNSFCLGFRPVIDINISFFAYYFRSENFRREVVMLAQGSTRFNISKKSMMDIKVCYPSIEEQQKIGQFFKNLDTQIEAEEKLLESYKQMKKSLLQKMFV